MEENKNPLLKHTMTYGAIVGIALVVFSVLQYITGLTFSKGLGMLQYVILLAGIYMGAKAYRDKVAGGSISYGKALWIGIVISFFAGFIWSFYNFLLMRYIDPDLVEKTLALLEEQYENSRFFTEDMIEKSLEATRSSLTEVWSIPLGALSMSFIGFIISLIAAAFIKKEANPFA